MTTGPRRVAIIGFGGVGTPFVRRLPTSERHEVAIYDIVMEVAGGRSKIRERTGAIGATPSPTAADQIDWAVDFVDNGFSLKGAPDADWRASLDAMAALAKLRRVGQELLEP